MTEKSITAAIRRYLKSIGAKVYKLHGSGMGVNGVPDLLGAYAGRSLALEVKRPGEELTALQKKELAEFAKAGAITGRVESVEDVKKILKGDLNGTSEKNEQPVFQVQINLVYRLHAKDKLDALDKVMHPLSLLNPPGAIDRTIKWADCSPPNDVKGNYIFNSPD